MATSLTNNTLTLNSQNYTAGTGGMILQCPTTSLRAITQASVDDNYIVGVIPSMTVGQFTRNKWKISSQTRTEVIKFPSSGQYCMLLSYSDSNSSVTYDNNYLMNMSGGSRFIASQGGGLIIRLS